MNKDKIIDISKIKCCIACQEFVKKEGATLCTVKEREQCLTLELYMKDHPGEAAYYKEEDIKPSSESKEQLNTDIPYKYVDIIKAIHSVTPLSYKEVDQLFEITKSYDDILRANDIALHNAIDHRAAAYKIVEQRKETKLLKLFDTEDQQFILNLIDQYSNSSDKRLRTLIIKILSMYGLGAAEIKQS